MVWEFEQLEMLSSNARGDPVEDVEVKKGTKLSCQILK